MSLKSVCVGGYVFILTSLNFTNRSAVFFTKICWKNLAFLRCLLCMNKCEQWKGKEQRTEVQCRLDYQPVFGRGGHAPPSNFGGTQTRPESGGKPRFSGKQCFNILSADLEKEVKHLVKQYYRDTFYYFHLHTIQLSH